MADQNIPIDIHTSKILDWLISRRHCVREWQDSIVEVRKKINSAIQDMPEVEEIKQLLAGSYINYFHCQRIVEILRETEKNSKNIFGQYSSQRMKDWQEIIKLHEVNNLYLAEAAQMLMRNVSYEVPSLKRQIAKCQQTQEECNRKEVEYGKTSQEMKDKFASMCKEIGIEGKHLRKELLELSKDLPMAFVAISEKLKQLTEAREFYLAFLNFILNNEDLANGSLPLLGHLIVKGNTTVYEWKYGQVPEIIEETQAQTPIDCSDQIDFGDDGGGIDFGDENSSSTTNGDFVHVEKIDFGDEDQIIELSSPAVSESNFDFPSESEILLTPDNRVARGVEAFSILDYSETRNQFINELRELEGFLEQRLLEMKLESDVLSANQFHSAPARLQMATVDSLNKMLILVRDVYSHLTTVKLQHLYLIKDSTKYVDRLVDSLEKKREMSDKMLLSQQVVAEKRKACLQEQRALQPKLELIIEKTKILQKQIEGEISQRYKGRPVNIMGGINTL